MRLRTLGLAFLIGTGLLPFLALADDATIASQLSESLHAARSDGQLQGFRLGVKVEDGTVWIKGNVANESQRTLALDKARRISGVRLVVNDIRIGVEEPNSGTLAQRSPDSRSMVRPASASASAMPAPAPSPRPVRQYRPTPMPVPMRSAQRSRRPARPVQYMETAGMPGGCPTGGCPADAGGYPMDGGGYAMDSGGYPVDAGYGSTAVPMPSRGGGYGGGYGGGGVSYDQPQLPGYAWPSYAAHPNYAGVSYPKQYSPMAWPYIGPFYPYPQVPLGWRKVSLEWDDGWWMLDFKSK